MSIGGRLQRFERRTEFNYSTGRSLPPKDIPGWKLLLDLFGNFAKIVGAIVTRDLQAALEGVKGFGNLDDNSAPDVAGVITSLAIIGKAIREKNKETLSVNTDGVDQIAKKHSITDEDYGLDGPRKHTLLLPFEESFGYVLQKNSREEKYKEAEAMYRQALAGCEEVVGREHPDTLTSVNNLGLVLSMLGNYEEAEAMHRRVLEARKKMLGLEHPDTLTSVRNLVNALDSQGKYEEAEAMYRQALDALEKVLGG
jgi:tetratricopeptide (TPR) repeat protein